MQSPTLPTKSKPPYLLGLLCIIPLVGAFVGLGLLLYGIIRYKDKWLIIIGAAGIIFTIAVYGSMIYYSKHGGLPKKGFATISQSQLNDLLKYIEIHKLQYGQYPDSLQQLLIDDRTAPIKDVIQSVQERTDSIYNYQKLADKYVLFSSGQDGLPNTEDDLFPDIRLTDSSKIGLIKPK